MEKKEDKVTKSVSCEVPQPSKPIAAQLWDVSGSPEPPLAVNFVKRF